MCYKKKIPNSTINNFSLFKKCRNKNKVSVVNPRSGRAGERAQASLQLYKTLQAPRRRGGCSSLGLYRVSSHSSLCPGEMGNRGWPLTRAFVTAAPPIRPCLRQFKITKSKISPCREKCSAFASLSVSSIKEKKVFSLSPPPLPKAGSATHHCRKGEGPDSPWSQWSKLGALAREVKEWKPRPPAAAPLRKEAARCKL